MELGGAKLQSRGGRTTHITDGTALKGEFKARERLDAVG